ncbi:MAG TPA: hypothetical protein HA224_04870 [Nanoarchaeota archaeon]|nr:hypothetical protein [Nanoarchaeota archaeon]
MTLNDEILEKLDGEVRPWFARQVAEGLPLARLVDDFTAQNYELQKSGILLRSGVTERFPDELEQLVGEADAFDIVLLRPSTLHRYGTATEVVRVLGGAGKFGSPHDFKAEQMPYGKKLRCEGLLRYALINYWPLEQGMFVHIDRGLPFGWKPSPRNYLELRAKLKKDKAETTEKKFDEW